MSTNLSIAFDRSNFETSLPSAAITSKSLERPSVVSCKHGLVWALKKDKKMRSLVATVTSRFICMEIYFRVSGKEFEISNGFSILKEIINTIFTDISFFF